MGYSQSSQLRNNHGISLIEVLIAVSLLSLGLIAFLALSNRSLNASSKAHHYYNLDNIILLAEQNLSKTSFATIQESIDTQSFWQTTAGEAVVVYKPQSISTSKLQLTGNIYIKDQFLASYGSIITNKPA